MKIKVSKDYNFNKFCFESDCRNIRNGFRPTTGSYDSTWEEMDVDIDQLHELISKGYAIRINC